MENTYHLQLFNGIESLAKYEQEILNTSHLITFHRSLLDSIIVSISPERSPVALNTLGMHYRLVKCLYLYCWFHHQVKHIFSFRMIIYFASPK